MASELASSKTYSRTSMRTSKADEGEDEQLYLLEVIVDKIDVFREGILETFQEGPQQVASATSVKKEGGEESAGPLRVLVKFFDFPTIEIQEKEFKKETEPAETEEKEEDVQPPEPTEEDETAVKKTPLIKENDAILKSKKQEEARWRAQGKLGKEPPMPTQYPGPMPPGQRFVSGKSCLFPMVPKEMIEVIKKYPLEIQVHRDATDVEPAHLIGTVRLNLGEEFIDAIATACSPSVLPVTAYIQGEYGVSNVFGDATGTVNLLIRMSCFGATIFTQFKYIQGQQGFKFSTSEGIMSSKSNRDKRMKAQKKEESKSDLNETVERPPFLTQEADILMFASPTIVDEFKVPVPWRKLTDEPLTPQTCGPKKLFKDIPRPRKEVTFDLKELFPSVERTVPEQQAFYPGQPIITGNTFEDCSCRGQAIPATSRQIEFSRTPTDTRGLPGQGGFGGGVLEIPPGTIFPCQFGQDWVVEAQPCDCPSPYSSKKKNPKPKVDMFPCPYYSRSGIGKDFGASQSQFDQPSQAPVAWSQSQSSRCDYPSLEQASPLLRSAAPPSTSENTGEYCVIGEPCFMGSRPVNQNRPNLPSNNQTGEFNVMGEPCFTQSRPNEPSAPSQKLRGNITYSNKSYVQYVSCPTSSSAPRTTVVCGLEGLLDPNQRNLQNLLQPGLMDPVCPPDLSRGQPSLCSCPKVPRSLPQPPPRGEVKCECTNILTSMKPVDLPYSCQQKLDSQATAVPITAPTSPPLPNKQSHPNPECPLANLLKKAEKDGAIDHTKTEKLDTSDPSSKTTEGVSIAEPDKTEVPTVSEATLKTSPDDQTLGKGAKKGADKARKILQDEAAAHTTMASELTGTGQADSKASSKGSSMTSYSSASKKKHKKKRKKPEVSREPPPPAPPSGTLASVYPGCVIGHKDCIPVIRWVPKKMGWLWNVKDADGFMKPGRGWRPGSIPTNVIKIMDSVKSSNSRNEKKTAKPYRKAEGYRHMAAGGGDGPLYKPIDDTPTVHLHKKHGKLYLSLCPPSKDPTKKKRATNQSNKSETVEEESDGDSDRPAQFRIDLKNPDGLVLDPDLYETEETSTNSEDSYQMEIIAPSTLRNRQLQPIKVDFEVQVTEESFLAANYDKQQANQVPHPKMKRSVNKKRSSASKKSVGKKSSKAK